MREEFLRISRKGIEDQRGGHSRLRLLGTTKKARLFIAEERAKGTESTFSRTKGAEMARTKSRANSAALAS
jgi:hypothetical protein